MDDTFHAETAAGLAIETSGAVGGVAVGVGARVLGARQLSGRRTHAADLVPTAEALCGEHGLAPRSIRVVFVSCGPGSFTGLRLGITVARMLALSGGVRVVPVPTLEVIAQNALAETPSPEHVAVILDAKRQRVYGAAFRRAQDAYEPTSEPAELAPAGFMAAQPRSCAVLGEGVLRHRSAVEASGLPVLPDTLYAPSAKTVYRLGVQRARRGAFADPRRLTPLYVRPPEAEERWAQRHGEAPDAGSQR